VPLGGGKFYNEGSGVRILVVEDETKVAGALRDGLANEGYDVSIAHTGEDGFFLIHAESFDLVILDLLLPGRSGLEILGAMRKRGLRVPVLILTAKDTVEDRVSGLDMGADDYLVKPFAFAELSARVRALLRRGQPEVRMRFTVDDLEIDVTSRSASRAGQQLELTPREFDLLEYLAKHDGQVVSREMLARDVWHEPTRHTPLDNVIDVHIARLRRKVDDRFPKKLLHTVRGVGFVLREEAL